MSNTVFTYTDNTTTTSSNTILTAASYLNRQTSLKSVSVGTVVTSIGDSCFSNCSNLISITISNSVTSLGNSVFYECIGLTSIIIPNSVTSIGTYCFYFCSALTSVTISNALTSLSQGCFYFCQGLPSLTIPNSIISLGDSCFYYCTSLTSITIPSNVTTIGNSCFIANSVLGTLTFSDSQKISSVGTDAFRLTKSGITVTYRNAANYDALPTSLKTTQSQFTSPTFVYDASCYTENTLITCFINGEEVEVKIQDIKVGMLVKTYNEGYVPVSRIGKLMIRNSDDVFNGLYKMKNNDLIVAGGHSILVDKLPLFINETNVPSFAKKGISFYKCNHKIQDKYLLLACDSDLFEPMIDNELYNVYHIVLESNNNNKNYGIYANGILSESTSLKNFIKKNFIDL
jgi:hypothetical protein